MEDAEKQVPPAVYAAVRRECMTVSGGVADRKR